MKTSTLWLWVFWACSGCLPSKGALDETASDFVVLDLNVRDALGGSWPLEAVPRAPQLQLSLDGKSDQADKRIWLVKGGLDDLLAEDLLDPPLRKSHQDRLLAISIERAEGGLRVASVAPLLRGERYSLVVLEAATQLWSRELRVSQSPAAGAAFIEGLPADQARGVPPNLQALLLRFDGYLGGAYEVSLRIGSDELEIQSSLIRCGALGLPEGDCLKVLPAQRLPSKAAALLEVQNLTDATGAALTALSVHFETGEELDTQAPTLAELTCALDERALDQGGCVLEQDRAIALRLAIDEPTLATLTTAHHTRSALSFGRHIEIALLGLEPELSLPSSLSLADLAGNTRTIAVGLQTQALLAALSIDEVRCDPLGPEPAQETIELLNFGGEPIQIMGFSVSDDPLEPGVRIRDELAVLPGERVLVVGPAFDARDASDGMLSPGVRLARTDKALSLSNEGSPIFLRDAQALRLSAAPRMKPAKASACIARITGDPRTGAAAAFAHDPQQTCTPGNETRWP